MQFLLIVGSSLLEDRAPIYEIIGSATTICACGGWMSRRHFWGRMPPDYGVSCRLNGPSRDAFVWEGTMPAGVARGMRGLRATLATRYSRRGCTNHHRRRGAVGAPLEHSRRRENCRPLRGGRHRDFAQCGPGDWPRGDPRNDQAVGARWELRPDL